MRLLSLVALPATSISMFLCPNYLNCYLMYVKNEDRLIGERDTLRSVQLRITDIYIYITRNVLLSAQMGEQASVVLICIITSRYNEVK